MNRTALSLMAIAGLMAFSSCSSEMTEEIAQSDDATATFTLKMPYSLGSRAGTYGDEVSASIDEITYSVFKVVEGDSEDSYKYQLLFEETKAYTPIGSETEIKIPLLEGLKYRVAFCAYSSKCKTAYASYSAGKLSVNYERCAANNVEQDMFVMRSNVFDLKSGAYTEVIKLTRPFAQLNWGASDAYAKVLDDYRDDIKVQVKIDPGLLCSELDVVKNKVTSLEQKGFTEETVALPKFNFKDIPSANDVSFPVENSDKPYNMVAMHYLLVDHEKATGDVCLEFTDGLKDICVSVENVPLVANYRTNIYGDLLTKPGDFKLSLQSAFGDGDEGGNISNPTIVVGE